MRRTLLVALPVIVAIIAGCGDDSDVTSLEGTWVGPGLGYNSGVYEERTSRLVITDVREDENVFVGYKQTRSEGEPFGPREIIQGAVGTDGRIFIADDDGFNFFELSEDTLVGQYLEAGKKDATVKNYKLVRE